MIYKNILIITRPYALYFSEWLKDEIQDILFDVWPNVFYTLNKQCHGNNDMHVLGGKQSMHFIYMGKEKRKKKVHIRIMKSS